jgi:quinol monooxygenase YgiN
MTVLVQMTVRPPSVETFGDTVAWMDSQGTPKGLHSSRVYRDENDAGLVCVLQEWDSHDAFHASSEEIGDEFNRRAGTEGLEWETHIWTDAGMSSL